MDSINGQRIFKVVFDIGVMPVECWRHYADGSLVADDRAAFLLQHGELGEVEVLEQLRVREADAAIDIAEILAKEAAWKTELGAVKAVKEAHEADKEARSFYELQQDLKAWDNDGDESRPSVDWREEEMYR
jgi:hypothetical protein